MKKTNKRKLALAMAVTIAGSNFSVALAEQPLPNVTELVKETTSTEISAMSLGEEQRLKQWVEEEIQLFLQSKPVIQEQGLENEIRKQLGKFEGELTHEDLQSIQTLDLSGGKISSLNGIKYLLNLTQLDISKNNIYNIDELMFLKNLSVLKAYKNDIVLRESFVVNKDNLTYLDLSKNGSLAYPLNLDHLQDLNSLSTLLIPDNSITNLSSLQSLTALNVLDARNNEINNISGLSNLNSLTSLRLDRNKISDISALSDKTSLKDLDLSYNAITNIDALSSSSSLETLNLSTNNISSISALSGMSILKDFKIDNNSISDISKLSDKIHLTTLSLNGNNVKDISILENLTSLNTLGLISNKIESISAIKGIKTLEYLNLGVNPIKDINLISGLTNLILLDLMATGTTDIGFISNMNKLTNVSLNKNSIKDISPLFKNNKFILTDLNESIFLRLADNNISKEQMNLYSPMLKEHFGTEFEFGKQTQPTKPVDPPVITPPVEEPTDPVLPPVEKPVEPPTDTEELPTIPTLPPRISGTNRFDTSSNIAKQVYPNGVDTVIIARGDTIEGTPNIADALSSSLLSRSYNSPVLLTGNGKVSQVTKDSIKHLGAKKVIVIGGENAISKSMEKEFGLKTERIAGANRYETAVEIAKKSNTKSKTVFIVKGDALADALAIGPVANETGNPILLVGNKGIPSVTKDYIIENGVKNIVIVGGNLVVSESTEKDLKALKGITVERVAGNNRYETSVKIAEKFWKDSKEVMIANGETMVDAVSASILKKPLLFVNSKSVSPSVKSYVKTMDRTSAIGGENAIPNKIMEELKTNK